MDNAAIYFARDIRETLVGMASVCRVHIMFLPTYSPELNPCELVFQWVKARLRLDSVCEPLWKRAQFFFVSLSPINKYLLNVPHPHTHVVGLI